MAIIAAILGFTISLLGLAKADTSLEKTAAWTMNLNDQLALSLYEYFGTNKNDTIEYSVADNSTKIVSREPILTKEFQTNCSQLSKRDRFEENADKSNSIISICMKNQVWEIDVIPSTGMLGTPTLLGVAPNQECYQTEYMKSLNIIALFCLNANQGSYGFYYVHIIDRATKKVIGNVQFNGANLDGYRFADTIKVRSVSLPKGGLVSDNVFLIYGEPLSDVNEKVVAQKNYLLFLVEVNPTTKQPLPIRVINLSKDANYYKDFTKALSYEVINQKLYTVVLANGGTRILRCDINSANPESIVPTCAILPSNINVGYGAMKILRGMNVAIYNKFETKYQFCSFKEADPKNVLQDCKTFAGRTDSDIDVRTFEAYDANSAFIYYTGKKVTNISLGIDKVNLVNGATSMFLDRFKDFATEDIEINGKFYSLTDAYFDVFDKTRSLEMVLESRLLIPDRSFKFDVIMKHVDKTDVKEFKGFRISKFLGSIERKSSFPRLIGYLKNVLRIPLGRSYFSGNNIQFNLTFNSSRPGDQVTGVVSNAGDAKLFIGGQAQNYVLTYYHSTHYQAMMISNQKIYITRCIKKVEANFVMECQKITEFDLKTSNKDILVGSYETPQNLVMITSEGAFYIYNKTSISSDAVNMQLTGLRITSVSFKESDSGAVVAILGTGMVDNKTYISLYELDQYNNKITLTKNITEYSAGAAQETGGEWCPKMLKYELEDTPILAILNACKDKDRRIVRFNTLNVRTPVQVSNTFIKVPEFRTDNLQMCPDDQTLIITAPNTNKALGIGYKSANTIMDLGFNERNELDAKSITKMVCLGNKAFAIGFFDNKDIFKIATFFTGKMPYADNRLHSILNFSEIGNTYKDFVGSEADGYVFLNVFSTNPEKNMLKALYLLGPDFYAKSEVKTNINDALVGVSNTNINAQYNLMFTFVKQKQNVYASSRTKKVVINSGQSYDIDARVLMDGPVFKWETPSTSVATVTPRINLQGELFNKRFNDTVIFNHASQVSNVGDNAFLLMQTPLSSILWIKPATLNPVAVNLKRRCHKMHVLAGFHGSSFMAFFSCIQKNEWRFYTYLVSADGIVSSTLVSNVANRSIMLDVEKSEKPNVYVLASIDDRNNLFTWYFDITTVIDTQDGVGTVSFIQNFNYTDVNNVRLVRTATRINVIYFRAKDTLARVTIINPLEPKYVDTREYHIVVTSDETTMSAFECNPLQGGMIGCIFASNGPLVYRIDFVEDPAAGLVQKTKSAYQLYHDNYAFKVVFNDMYFALLSLSPEKGNVNILVYKLQSQLGSDALWSGIPLQEFTNRPVTEIDLALLDNNRLIFTTNHIFPNGTSTLTQAVELKNATITPKTNKISELAEHNVVLNDKTVIGMSQIRLSHFFLHIDEMNGSNKGLSGNYWILMIICFAIIFGSIYWFYRQENMRRAKLREEVLCNNLGADLKF